MRLATLVPSIPASLVSCMEQCGVRTDTDLLFAPIHDIFSRLPSGTVTLDELMNYVDLVSELTAAPGMSGVDMLQTELEAQKVSSDFSSGVTELDQLLGDFRGRQVFEISGDTQSGKTALVLHLVLRHLARYIQSTAIWLDTTGEFSAERATEILASYDTEASLTALERLQVSVVFDIESAFDILDELASRIPLSEVPNTRLSCIVVDSITPLIGPLLSPVSAQGHATMTNYMYQLRVLARNSNMAVFVINNTTFCKPNNPNSAFESTVRKPSLGPSFPFLTDATLWLSKYEHDREGGGNDDVSGYTAHIAEVFRSKNTRSNTWCLFKLQQGKAFKL